MLKLSQCLGFDMRDALATMPKHVGTAFDAKCFGALTDALKEMQREAA